MNEIINEAESVLLHTYNRYQIVFDHGEGVFLYDTEGKKYLDFMAGISVHAFGHCNKELNEAMKAQIDKIIHTSNYYYNEPAVEAAKKLVKATGLSKVFFTNSGADTRVRFSASASAALSTIGPRAQLTKMAVGFI